MTSQKAQHLGQSVIEYAVLVAAVSVAVILAANVAYRAFAGRARAIEETQIFF